VTAEQRWLESADAVAAGHPGWIMNLWEGYPAWITIPGPPHAKARPRVVRGRAYAPDGSAERAIAWQMRSAHRGPPLEGPVAVYVRFWMPDLRARDLDNLAKCCLDAGNQARLWLDDRQVVALVALKDLDRENPRTELAFGPRRGTC